MPVKSEVITIMKILNNEHKKSNAKLFYDLLKIVLAILVLTPIARKSYEPFFVVTSLIACIILWLIAYLLERSVK